MVCNHALLDKQLLTIIISTTSSFYCGPIFKIFYPTQVYLSVAGLVLKKGTTHVHLKIRTFLHIINHARASCCRYIRKLTVSRWSDLLIRTGPLYTRATDAKYLADYRGCVRQSGFRKFHKTALSPAHTRTQTAVLCYNLMNITGYNVSYI